MTQTHTQDDVMVELERHIRRLLPSFAGEIARSSQFQEMEMDSLTQVDLLAAMETAFDIDIPDDEVSRLRSVGDLVDLVLVLRERT